jgi:hypothetical protein
MNENTRSKDFRYIHVNALSVQFNGEEMILRLGVSEDLGQTEGTFFEEIALVMSATSAKLIGETLSTVVASFEKTNNTTIPVAASALKTVQAALEQSEKDREAAAQATQSS